MEISTVHGLVSTHFYLINFFTPPLKNCGNQTLHQKSAHPLSEGSCSDRKCVFCINLFKRGV
ncbi:hypothetical protein SAMN05444000_1425 [Shimia gijangensis]|uniref:Uncharacterized protein n=1 Tax=Shimia gijangensis TaxID=1470563 RepID=A0A1M6TMT3_9RHOB|nr:hypothetical protein SAMN05444000_1425 [Shimia gijangensis]